MSGRLAACVEHERRRFVAATPRSAALARRAARHWLDGVPMHWMADWGTPHPLFVAAARGATLTDVDGRDYADFCPGDTGAMYGHAPPPVVAAIAAQAAAGLTCMLPAARVDEVGERLAQLFGLPCWQLAQTATDANRAALRWARAITGRPRVLVFHGAYHGTVDETMVRLRGGRTVAREGAIGAPFDNASAAVAVEFNDLPAVETALAAGDVAAVICEPAMTNVGVVLPCAVYGFTAAVESAIRERRRRRAPGHSGIGTTLAGNPLAIAALHAALGELITPANHARMDALGARLEAGLRGLFAARALGWHVSRIGARTEFGFGPAPANGSEAEAAMRPDLQQALHLALLNRGVLVTPFHNMMLTSPATTEAQVDALLAAVAAGLDALA